MTKTTATPAAIRMNHAECAHDRTPAGRAACRLARATALLESITAAAEDDTEAPANKLLVNGQYYVPAVIGMGKAVHYQVAFGNAGGTVCRPDASAEEVHEAITVTCATCIKRA